MKILEEMSSSVSEVTSGFTSSASLAVNIYLISGVNVLTKSVLTYYTVQLNPHQWSLV